MFFIVAFTVLVASLAGSISGLGGGVLIKPVMDAVSGLTAAQINFASSLTVLTIAVTSLLRSRGEGALQIRTVFLAIGAAVGGVCGKLMFNVIRRSAGNDHLVSIVQNAIMVVLISLVFIYTLNKAKVKTKDIHNMVLTTVAGLTLGILSSFLGIGGGPINLMVLFYLFSMDTKTAALNSLLVILFSQSLSLVFTLASGTVPQIDPWIVAAMAALAVVGATVGRSTSKRMDEKAVDRLFLFMMALIIGVSIYNCARNLIAL